MLRRLLTLLALPALVFATPLRAQVTELPPYTVTGRQVSPAAESPWSLTPVTAAALTAQPGQSLDDVLRAVPGFSLFRRSSSRLSNPPTQGVTLRGIGPSGASRALVLLDGVPINDPFGGWVTWSALDLTGLTYGEITRSGGAGPWGNGALGGTIALFTAPIAAGGDVGASLASHGGHTGRLQAATVSGAWSFSAGVARTHGIRLPVLGPTQRGAVDNDAFADSTRYQVQIARTFGDFEAGLRAGYFDEQRGNGTQFTQNSTDARDLSVWLKRATGDLPWEIRAWRQQRDFASTFSAVNATRTVEMPSLDQYTVPALATGFSALLHRTVGRHTFLAGADARTVRGTTNERFRYIGTAFTRDREAGGRQTLAGLFAEDQIRLTAPLRLTLGARLDRWELTDGHRRERDLATGALTRDDTFAGRDGTRTSLRAGLNYQPTKTWTLRAAAYNGFRVATLNELYRPFRVRNDVTEANPALSPETLTGTELGADWRPAPGWQLSLTGYDNRLHDLIANATLAVGPATVPGFDPVLAGGVLRQRTNSGNARARGLEFTARHETKTWTTAASLTLGESRWANATGALTTQLLVQTPRWTAAANTTWRPTPEWTLTAQARAVGRQYEDDLNTLRLGAFGVADLAASYELTACLRPLLTHGRSVVRLGVENLFDARIETAKTADGLVSIGAPRLLTLDLQYTW